MEFEEFLRKQELEQRNKFVKIFKEIQEESSTKLLAQMRDRLRKNKSRLHHSRTREASLKDKLSNVSEAISKVKDAKINSSVISILEEWRNELFQMLEKVEAEKHEKRRIELMTIRDRIERRAPFVKKIIQEFDDGSAKS